MSKPANAANLYRFISLSGITLQEQLSEKVALYPSGNSEKVRFWVGAVLLHATQK
jgi:hypothetical protein